MVAAAVGSMNDLLKPYPAALFEPENPTSLASAIRFQLEHSARMEIEVPTWRHSAERLESFFQRIAHERTGA